MKQFKTLMTMAASSIFACSVLAHAPDTAPASELGNATPSESGSGIKIGSQQWLDSNICVSIASAGEVNKIVPKSDLRADSDRYYCGDTPRGKDGVNLAYSKVEVQPQVAKKCSSDDENAAEGARCQTTAGVEFVRVRDPQTGSLGWKDTSKDGKIWYDGRTAKGVDEYDAEAFCSNKQSQTLPKIEDIKTAGIHGFEEICPSFGYLPHWSKTLTLTHLAYFYGGIGTQEHPVDTANRKSSVTSDNLRQAIYAKCVGL